MAERSSAYLQLLALHLEFLRLQGQLLLQLLSSLCPILPELLQLSLQLGDLPEAVLQLRLRTGSQSTSMDFHHWQHQGCLNSSDLSLLAFLLSVQST